MNLAGETVLHYACKLEFCDIIKHLIKFGANVNVQDKLGHTPLHLAVVTYNYKDVVMSNEHFQTIFTADVRWDETEKKV